MKKFELLISLSLLLLSCTEKKENYPETPYEVSDPITISSPTPSGKLTKVSLSEGQLQYVSSGNAFAFNTLAKIYEGKSVIFSPLSLQYALAMTVNGASGKTANEITKALGYGSDVKALNEYCNILLNELPAVDTDVDLKLTDLMLVTKDLPAKDSFRNVLNNKYYAPLEYFYPQSVKEIVDRINEWAYRTTNGFIDKLVEESDIDPDLVAAIMNALYFKAKWAGSEYRPMFLEAGTLTDAEFTLDGGGKSKVDLMRTSRYLPYAKRDGYSVVSIPYSNGNFAMYVLLPDEKGGNGVRNLLEKLPDEKWEDICGSFDYDTEVHLRLPKFETENKFYLKEAMKALGIQKAFVRGVAEFDNMFDAPDWYFWIDSIIQKAHISVAEWGTEAAAVTVVLMLGDTSPGPDPEKKVVDFYADHPFVYVIAEKTSGVILFEGVFDGRKN